MLIEQRLLTVYSKYSKYNVARHAVVECGACSSDVSDVTRDCPYFGLTARGILDVDDDFRADREKMRAPYF